MADQPIDSSPALAAVYTAVLAEAGIGGITILTDFEQYPFPSQLLPAILIGQTDFNSEVVDNGWLRSQVRSPNVYTAWVLLAKLTPQTSFAGSVALYHQLKPVLMRALNTRSRLTLGGVVRLAGHPYRWQNDSQGPFVNFMFENFIGARITCAVYEQQETILDDTQ